MPVKFWNKSSQTVKFTIYFPDSEKINSELFKQREALNDLFIRIVEHYERKPPPKELGEAFKSEYFENNSFFIQTKVKIFPEDRQH